jgi:hypothetical protein
MSAEGYRPKAIQSEEDITRLISNDNWRMDVLKAAENLNLPNWWIGAGFLRNLVWDAIEGKTSRPKDVDLVYFNDQEAAPETDWGYDEMMKKQFPFAEWEVRNQARMHYVNGFEPYTSTEDGISHWVETATCVAVNVKQGKYRYLFCHGTDDLFGLVARPIPIFRAPKLMPIFFERVEKKQWQEKWPHLKVESK